MNHDLSESLFFDLVENKESKFQRRIRLIEERQIDITESYEAWYKIGIALTKEFGESGIPYFHRICRFYPRYSEKECTRMYYWWLKKCSHYKISIGTFFYYTDFLEK